MMPSSTSSQLDSQLYVQQLRFRHPTTSKVYRCVLNGFLRFVSQQAEDKTLSRETIREWVKDRILVWPFHLVAHRARLVDRFLDWAITQGAIGANPLGDLRKEYGQRTTTPVVRALLAPEFETALEALRPAPRFGSFFGPTMREHVEFMRAMGYRYNVQEERMLRLDRFLQSQPDLSGQPLTVLIRQWTCAGSTAQHTLECHLTGRLLSSYFPAQNS
jgi:hypothetical protein